ncbi:DUF6434 domain-containing protein [Microbacterium sp. A84]|uniref:DUF6434 domain-containing protein n=1 Tax=Microbacterium sp. A84 TaxID=3450715 RepID=UPI003F423BA7
MTSTNPQRPDLTGDLTGNELLRWYWLKDELADFARSLGIRATGSKEVLTQRLAAALNGVSFTEPVTQRSGNKAQLSGPLSASTVIPRGQPCSQTVRAWFIEQVGESFGFDGELRAFFADADGTQTLQDALEHYYASRDQGQKAIGSQFEYNRFTRAWYQAHPEGSREDLIEAWRDYRRRPVDERGRI